MDQTSNIMNNVCLSGGAKGADAQWGMTAGKLGHMVVHWSFDKHKYHVPKEEVIILTKEQLEAADPFCIQANKTLKRNFHGCYTGVKNLLRRNYYQVKDTERVYAVSHFDNSKVSGGTAWAVQMAIDIGVKEIYVYDQNVSKWFSYVDGHWFEIESPPQPFGVWTGIGTRELNISGKNAIRKLMNYNP